MGTGASRWDEQKKRGCKGEGRPAPAASVSPGLPTSVTRRLTRQELACSSFEEVTDHSPSCPLGLRSLPLFVRPQPLAGSHRGCSHSQSSWDGNIGQPAEAEAASPALRTSDPPPGPASETGQRRPGCRPRRSRCVPRSARAAPPASRRAAGPPPPPPAGSRGAATAGPAAGQMRRKEYKVGISLPIRLCAGYRSCELQARWRARHAPAPSCQDPCNRGCTHGPAKLARSKATFMQRSSCEKWGVSAVC